VLQVAPRIGRHWLCLALLAQIVSTATACGPAKTDLVGLYRLDHSFGVEYLRLNLDGSYEQRFVPNAGQETRHAGKWDARPGDRWEGLLVVLHEPLLVDDPFGRSVAPKEASGDWLLPAHRGAFGGVYLTSNEDAGLYFRKLPRADQSREK
jgi:hypothetical protein